MHTKMLFLVLLMAFTSAVQAQRYAPDIRHRQIRQGRMIAGGLHRGQLDRFEARRLVRQQQHIQRAKRRAQCDGRINRNEHRRIAMRQMQAGRQIQRMRRQPPPFRRAQ